MVALAGEDGTVDLALRCAGTRFHADHFRARFRPAEGIGAPDVNALILEGDDVTEGPLSLEPDRDLYGSVLFQSGRFRRLSGYRWLRATECVADIGAGGTEPWFGPYLPDHLVLGDPGARDAAIHAIQACIPHRVLLPIAVERIERAHLPASRALVARARERSRAGETFVYDLTIGEPGGPVLERWTGLTLKAVAAGRLPESWSESLLATYLERRLAELVPGATRRVSAVRGRRADGAARAIETSIAKRVRLMRRPDGRPELPASAGATVSAAHADGVFLAMSGSGAISADVEAVVERTEEQWRGLLGEERWALSRTVAEAAGEDPTTARTRMWTALECLKKVGVSLDTPLLLKGVSEDGWVLLDAGSHTLASWVGVLRCKGAPAAIGLLSENDHAGV